MSPHRPFVRNRYFHSVAEEPYVSDERAVQEMRRIGEGARQPLLRGTCAHLLAGRGKFLRSTLVLRAAALGPVPDPAAVFRAAAAVETIHLASLAHDDVIDDSSLRRGAPTAGAVFGCAAAAFAGARLFARSVEAVAECGDAAVALLARAMAELCDGEMLELEDFHDLDRTRERYLRVVHGKTGVLFALSARLGAELGGLGPAECGALEDFGALLGTAFQIADDILDLVADEEVTGKPRGTDLLHGVYTLPVLYALQDDPQLRRRLRVPVGTADLPELADRIVAHGGVERALRDCRRFADDAKRAVDGVARDGHRRELHAFVDRAIAPVVGS